MNHPLPDTPSDFPLPPSGWLPDHAGRVACFERHTARQLRSLAEPRMANPYSRAEWRAIAKRLVDTSATI